jgi:hypothetical protein
MDSYLLRFKRYAQAQGWKDVDQAIYLSALLKGDALEMYSRMSQRDANDYDKLKDALLKRYQLTEYGFKRKFYSAKQDKAEASGQFVARLEHYLDRWIEMTGIDHTYGALKDLLVLEQYLWKSPRELSTYIREHATKDLDEVAKLAETYLEAHTYPESKKTANKGNEKKPSLPDVRPKSNSSWSADQNKPFRKNWFVCGGNHYARDCNKRAKPTDSTKSNPAATALANVSDREYQDDKPPDPDLILEGLPTTPGLVNGTPVTVLWDSGCLGVIVKRSLVSDDSLTGKVQSYICADRSVQTVPTAMISIESPHYNGRVETLCLENPLFELIIGNDVVPRKMHNELVSEPNLKTDVAPEVISNVMVTRGATRKNQTSMKLQQLPEIATRAQFKQFQEDDSSLDKLRDSAQSGKETKRSSMLISFIMEDNLLYRKVVSLKTRAMKGELQLVVPKCLQTAVLERAHSTILAGHM